MTKSYIGSTIRDLHIRIKEHLNTLVSSFHKHLIKCKNNDNFPIKIETIVRNVDKCLQCLKNFEHPTSCSF